MTEGSLVYDRAEPFGGLIGYQSAVIVPILKMAKSDPTGIDEQLSFIAAMSVDNREAIAQMAFEAEIFLALKAISTGTPDGTSDRNFFEKVLSHGESRLANGLIKVNTHRIAQACHDLRLLIAKGEPVNRTRFFGKLQDVWMAQLTSVVRESTIDHSHVAMIAMQQPRQVNQHGKENMNPQPKRNVSLDDPMNKKQFQDMMSEIGQILSSILLVDNYIKEHIVGVPQRKYQTRTNFR